MKNPPLGASTVYRVDIFPCPSLLPKSVSMKPEEPKKEAESEKFKTDAKNPRFESLEIHSRDNVSFFCSYRKQKPEVLR